jgi:hypothetical protein
MCFLDFSSGEPYDTGVFFYRQKQQQQKRKTAGHMKQPYHASSHEDLVLMVSLDAITKIG